MVVSIAGVATGWIRVPPLQQTGTPGCGLGLRPHHIDEQKERSPPSSDRKWHIDTCHSFVVTIPPWAVTVRTLGSAFC